MKHPPPRVVVFDLDDTLILERNYAFSGYDAVDRFVRDQYGIVGFGTICRDLFKSGVRERIFNEALTQLKTEPVPQVIASLVDCYRSHSPKIELLSDASDCLRALKGQVHLSLITDGYQVSQHAKIRSLGLSQYFDHLRVTDDWGREFWKPHLRSYQEVTTLFDVAPTECVYVGDNPTKDFLSPSRLGWQTVRVRRPEGLHADTDCDQATDGSAEIEIPDLTKLIDVLFDGTITRAA